MAENIGYWDWTWSASKPLKNATMSIAFSGWADVDTAIQQSDQVRDSLVADKYICLGGGNSNGAFDAISIQAITAAIKADRFSDYDGIAYDVEEGSTNLASDFATSFYAAKQKGLKVLVTVSHSAPYGITDAAALMKNFFSDENIDYLSPQLYTTGKETENDYAVSHGVDWEQYAHCKAAVVPSIVQAAMYDAALNYFARDGVKLQGYIQWD